MKLLFNEIAFVKMEGCGNDYIYIDCIENQLFQESEVILNEENKNEFYRELAVKISDRHFGVGSDGMVLILPSEEADAKMRMFNSDGSEGKMCGNAVRCVAKYLWDKGLTDKSVVDVETLSGIKEIQLVINKSETEAIAARVSMGLPELESKNIPVDFTKIGLPINDGPIIDQEVEIKGFRFRITCVSMGNPHAVIFCDNVASLDIKPIGAAFEKSALFPESINTEFVQIIDPQTIKVRVWERGSSETLSCGTGAAASVVAACLNDRLKKFTEINVKMLGGDLKISYGETVYLTGPCKKICNGYFRVNNGE